VVRQSLAIRGYRQRTTSPHHQAAAVLAAFNPEMLVEPTVGRVSVDSMQALLADSTIVEQGNDGTRWTLTPDARRMALMSFPDIDVLRSALSWNPRPQGDAFQQVWKAGCTVDFRAPVCKIALVSISFHDTNPSVLASEHLLWRSPKGSGPPERARLSPRPIAALATRRHTMLEAPAKMAEGLLRLAAQFRQFAATSVSDEARLLRLADAERCEAGAEALITLHALHVQGPESADGPAWRGIAFEHEDRPIH
jgi:hypothetical protein